MQERKRFPCASSDPPCSCTRKTSLVPILCIFFSHFLSLGFFKHQQVSPTSESPSVALYSCGRLHISFSLPIFKKASDFISFNITNLSLQFCYSTFPFLTVSNPPYPLSNPPTCPGLHILVLQLDCKFFEGRDHFAFLCFPRVAGTVAWFITRPSWYLANQISPD